MFELLSWGRLGLLLILWASARYTGLEVRWLIRFKIMESTAKKLELDNVSPFLPNLDDSGDEVANQILGQTDAS